MNFRSIMVFVVLLGCAEEQSSGGVPLNTVDSKVSLGDSTPAILHLDRPDADTSYEVALDSVGRTITPQDNPQHR